ncbi:MAG: transporter substrate-binding domain-containing protein [Clostridia bacterium]
MKRLIVGILVILMLLTAFACTPVPADTQDTPDKPVTDAPPVTEPATTEDDAAYITGNGKMKIGITIYEPMNYYDAAGKLIGFDTEFAEAVCKDLGITPEFIEINWDTKEIEINAKNIDCIWNGFTVNEERRANMGFSDSYIKNMQVAVIRTADAEKFKDAKGLADATLAAEIGSAGETAIADDAVLSGAKYVAVAKQTDALLEVKAGTADAAVLDYVLAKSMVGEGTDYSDLMIMPNAEFAVEEYAIGFRLGSNMVPKINEVLAKLIADGTLDKIAEKYDLTASLMSNQ